MLPNWMKLPVDDVLSPVKFGFSLTWLEKLVGALLIWDLLWHVWLHILLFVISFFSYLSFFVFFIFSLTKDKHAHHKLTTLSLCIYLSAHLPFPIFNFWILIPPLHLSPPPVATLRLHRRIISSTWVSWGCSGQLVSSSCWGREKPSASCSGPLFNPSRFTLVYTE